MAAVCLRLLGGTLRFETRCEKKARPADTTTDADLYAFWHRSLLMAAYRYRELDIRILISQSFDGELIARTVERMGFVAIRGSSSRGGAAGLLRISRALAGGFKCAITADGPRGPMYVAKEGAAAIPRNAAARSGSAQRICAFALHAERAWTLRSWDRFVIPKPFSRVTAAWAEPIAVGAEETLESVHAQLQEALHRAVALSEEADSGGMGH